MKKVMKTRARADFEYNRNDDEYLGNTHEYEDSDDEEGNEVGGEDEENEVKAKQLIESSHEDVMNKIVRHSERKMTLLIKLIWAVFHVQIISSRYVSFDLPSS